MYSDQVLCSDLHGLNVERLAFSERVATPKWIAFSVQNTVAIEPVLSPKPTMKLSGNLLRGDDFHIRRQNSVQCIRPSLRGDGLLCIKVAYLASGVRTGIGSAGSCDLDFLARDQANPFCQCAMDSSLSGLRRPAAKIVSVVLNDKLYSLLSRQVPRPQSGLRRLGGDRSW